jgi:Lon protease-like protein
MCGGSRMGDPRLAAPRIGIMSQGEPVERWAAVPLFPLPNVVLFPGAVLPLHIFEERYKKMTRDALDGAALVAMALLRAGWEKNYYQRPAIEPVVCVGKIIAHEKLADGKYNFLLQGQARARVVGEVGDAPYRLGRLTPLHETAALEIDLEDERRRLRKVFGSTRWKKFSLVRKFVEMLDTDVSTPQVADLVAFNFLEDVQLKQMLLQEEDVKKRVRSLLAAIEEVGPHPDEARAGDRNDPSMN